MAQIILPKGVAPATPASGYSVIYPKSDGLWYSKDDAGIESVMSGAALAGSTTQTFSVAAATAAAHAVRSDQVSADNVNFPYYAIGTWTPNQGAGLTVVGAFSSTGLWIRTGNLITIHGSFNGATSITSAAAGVLCTNLPFTVNAIAGNGIANNAALTQIIGVKCQNGTTTMYSSTAMSTASPAILFSASYSL